MKAFSCLGLSDTYGIFPKLGVPYLGVLIIRILLFRVIYLGPYFRKPPYPLLRMPPQSPSLVIQASILLLLGFQGRTWREPVDLAHVTDPSLGTMSL